MGTDNSLVVRDADGFVDMSESLKRAREFFEGLFGGKPKNVHTEDIVNYNVRLYQRSDGSHYIVYACNGTRLETLEYNTEREAKSDFWLLIKVIRTVLHCEGRL